MQNSNWQTMMIEYAKIWKSINNESTGSHLQPQIARKIPTKGLFDVFLATDVRKNIRLLYIRLDESTELAIENFPTFRGLEISSVTLSLGEFSNSIFLRFSQSIPKTDNIFELIISDLCDNIVQLRNKSKLFECLTKTLSEWKLFFERQANRILSISCQKGLFGELSFLKDYLFCKYSYDQSLHYWTAYERTNHDFEIMDRAVEIKTTSGKQHKRFSVSSERQLDDTGLTHLYLVLYSLNLHSNMHAKSLPTLIQEISARLQNDPISLFKFKVKLAKSGYDETITNKYTMGFSIVNVKSYEVADGFPRLLQRDLPEGVGDLKYSVVAAACSNFELTSNILNHL